jgi:CBS domain-containing protein
MTPSDRIADIAKQLAGGGTVQPVTVREFLQWFDAQRRGYWIVSNIRDALDKHKLRTEPDFESEYIDSPISFVLVPDKKKGKATEPKAVELAATVAASASMVATLTTSTTYADPTYRISKLGAANNAPLSVTPDATLAEAATKMLTHGYSQLPVMTNAREVKGVISWSSIGARLALGKPGTVARELMDQSQEIRADASIFQAIPIIVQHQYVLVRGADNRISGIVTASDLSLQFQQLAEPFLLLSEIENHVRRLIGAKFNAIELLEARDPGATERKIDKVADMAFGEYIRLLENPERWSKLQLAIDRATFCRQLDRVRGIRNDVMHFDPDGISPDDLETLREFTRFLQQLQNIGIS